MMQRHEFGFALILLLTGCSGGGEVKQSGADGGGLSSDTRMNLDLAQGYLEAGKLDKAKDRIDAALSGDPRSAEGHALRAMLFARQGDSEKAGRPYDQALKLAPANGSILNAHASWLCEHGRAEQADGEFARALADPNYADPIQALANAGKCALGANRLPQAEDYLRRALVFGPQDKALLFLLADVELRQGKIFEAQAFIQRRDALGSDANTLDLAARIEDAAGNAMAAARYRQRLHDEFPEHVSTGEGTRSP